ncbi:hypothetical protein BTA31_17680 [Bacillus haynesii]|uniref:Uncharacterized protein n=1 Tax=Bacillus haynesii TaxID=1925021 RepID=A0ABX3I155_9BACI|nr:hypothetical protein BTA31_17680 [Bacillus haynesii]
MQLMQQGIGAEASCHQLDFLTALIMTYTMPNTINTEMIAGPNGISQPPKVNLLSIIIFTCCNKLVNQFQRKSMP